MENRSLRVSDSNAPSVHPASDQKLQFVAPKRNAVHRLHTTEIHPLVSPPPPWGAGMAYDPNTQTVVLFGGNIDQRFLRRRLDVGGVAWAQQFLPVSPPVREFDSNAMVFDSAIGEVLMFGDFIAPG
jgi:hypothetical protein